MKIEKIINITEGDIITVVGAGGKTSFINNLSKCYKDKYKILLTTTTKIYVPKKSLYDYIYMIKDKVRVIQNKGITVCGKYINKENKIVGLDFYELESMVSNFDIVFIEGDGSKRKKLKGWNETEPVVYDQTTKTIGILDITSIDMDINEENIHRLEEFKKITKKQDGNVDINDLKSIVINKNGLFKYSKGSKILFINKVEDDYYKKIAKQLIKLIHGECIDIKIVYGSIKNKIYNEI